MTMCACRVDVWVGGMKDRAGVLSAKLEALACAGAQLDFVMARRAAEKPGTGVVFLAPIKGAGQAAAAKRAGFHKSKSVIAVRVEGPDKPGVGAQLTCTLAEKGINLRGLSAAVVGKRFVAYFALDSAADAAKAVRALKV